MLAMILYFLSFILCLTFLLVLLVLFVPFVYSVQCDIESSIKSEAVVCWMFRFFKVKLFIERKNKNIAFFIASKKVFVKNLEGKKLQEEKQKEKRKKKTKKKRKTKIKIKEYLNKNFLHDIFLYIRDIIKIIKPATFNIKGIYGFEDPSVTGAVCGFVSILSEAVVAIPLHCIKLQPMFEEEIIDIEMTLSGKIIIAMIAFRTIKLVLKKEIRKKIFKKTETVET